MLRDVAPVPLTDILRINVIVIGKANMSELADYKSKHAGAGWSAVGGQTINVYVSHSLCESSFLPLER